LSAAIGTPWAAVYWVRYADIGGDGARGMRGAHLGHHIRQCREILSRSRSAFFVELGAAIKVAHPRGGTVRAPSTPASSIRGP
jgi:hypothetical protein